MEHIKKKIENKDISKLSMGTIDFVIEQGNKAVDNLIAVGDKIKHKGEIILLALVGAFVSTLGYLILNYQKVISDFVLLVMLTYGITAIFLISCYLWRKVLHKRNVYYSGDSPLHVLREQVLDIVGGLENENDREAYIKGWELNEIQQKVENNTQENNRLLKGVNNSIKYIFCALIIGVLIFIVLCLEKYLGWSNLLELVDKGLKMVLMWVFLYP